MPQSGEIVEESGRTLLKWLQLDDEGGLVGTLTCDEVISEESLAGLDGRVGSKQFVDLLNTLASACLTSTGSHRHCTEEHTIVLVGHKTGLGGCHSDYEYHNTESHGDTGGNAVLDNILYTFLIFSLNPLILIVECIVETVNNRLLAMLSVAGMRLQQDGTKGWRQCQRVERGDKNRHRHGDTEHTIERTACTAHERYWHEHGCHHKSNRDDSSGNLVHRVDRCIQCTLISLVELGVYSLHHHNGVIHHNGDGKKQCREHKQVDGESEYPQEEERTDKSHRHGNHRNKC